jgi:hypothetical protein
MTYRPRKLKPAKSPITAAALRYFAAPIHTTDDYYAMVDECNVRPEATDDLLRFYYDASGWKDVYREHRGIIEADWESRFPDRKKRAAHRRWALQSFQDRLHQTFIAERDRTAVNN